MNTSLFESLRSFVENTWLYGGAFILVLGILVFVHEWGHYIVARWNGVRVEKFSIGFGPELFGINDRHGTRWKICAIPLGGYVQMFGNMDPAGAKDDDTVQDGEALRPMTENERKVAFFTQSLGARAAIVFAGPAINFLFAIFILTILYLAYGQPVTPPLATAVMENTAAERAGFMPYDEILAVDGKKVKRFQDLRREVSIGLDKHRVFTIRRDGQVMQLEAVPERLEQEDKNGFKSTRGFLGLVGPGSALDVTRVVALNGQSLETPEKARDAVFRAMQTGKVFQVDLDRGEETDRLHIRPLPELNKDLTDPDAPLYNRLVIQPDLEQNVIRYRSLLGSALAATKEVGSITLGTLNAFGQILTGTRSAKELGGIIRIGTVAGDTARAGFWALAVFTAMLSVNLGLINLFPIPMLDGGHLFFYALEALRGGKPVPENIQDMAFRAGFVFLIAVMVFTNLNDILQLVL